MPQGFSQKDNKVKRVSLIVIILAVLGGLAMYFFTNNFNVPSFGTQSTEPNKVSTTPAATLTVTKPFITVAATTAPDKFLTFYVDKNHNLLKDGAEVNCTVCKSKTVLIGVQDGGIGPISASTSSNIDSSSKINTSKFTNQNVVWGNVVDAGLLIPPTAFALGDATGDISIPVWDATAKVSAINANVIQAINENGTVVYEFSKLIPSMKTIADKGDSVWVKFTPDKTNDAKFFLTSGKLTVTHDGYSLKVSWDSANDALNVLKVDNIEFVVP